MIPLSVRHVANLIGSLIILARRPLTREEWEAQLTFGQWAASDSWRSALDEFMYAGAESGQMMFFVLDEAWRVRIFRCHPTPLLNRYWRPTSRYFELWERA